MTWWAVLICILLVILTGAISFLAGIRYCSSTMLAAILARKTPEELNEIAREAAALAIGPED